jgi:hypothetical protein
MRKQNSSKSNGLAGVAAVKLKRTSIAVRFPKDDRITRIPLAIFELQLNRELARKVQPEGGLPHRLQVKGKRKRHR